MRRHREARGVRQETIAVAATLRGLPWTQSTVAAIELGQRAVSVDEFVQLPLVFAWAGIDRASSGRSLVYADFIPEDVDHEVRTLLRGRSVQSPLTPAVSPGRHRFVFPLTWTVLAQAGPGEAERKAARKLGCSPDAIVTAAREHWGHLLSEERDKRIGDRAGALDRRSLQAVRGRVTRALVRELEPTIKRPKRRK